MLQSWPYDNNKIWDAFAIALSLPCTKKYIHLKYKRQPLLTKRALSWKSIRHSKRLPLDTNPLLRKRGKKTPIFCWPRIICIASTAASLLAKLVAFECFVLVTFFYDCLQQATRAHIYIYFKLESYDGRGGMRQKCTILFAPSQAIYCFIHLFLSAEPRAAD